MSTASDRLGNQARVAAEDLQKMGETVIDAAQEKVGQIGDRASEYGVQGRDKVHDALCGCEQFLRERPLSSVLTAAGIGWLLGRFWKRR